MLSFHQTQFLRLEPRYIQLPFRRVATPPRIHLPLPIKSLDKSRGVPAHYLSHSADLSRLDEGRLADNFPSLVARAAVYHAELAVLRAAPSVRLSVAHRYRVGRDCSGGNLRAWTNQVDFVHFKRICVLVVCLITNAKLSEFIPSEAVELI